MGQKNSKPASKKTLDKDVDSVEDGTREHVDFIGSHICNSAQKHAAMHGLTAAAMPSSICDIVVNYLCATEYAAYCKVSLTFKSSEDDKFDDFRVPPWLQTVNDDDFMLVAYSMVPNARPCQPLSEWEYGSSWGMEWGGNVESDADWKVHHYFDSENVIYKNKATKFTSKDDEKRLVKFMLIAHTFANQSYLMELDNEECWYQGGCAVLCVDYAQPDSLKTAAEFVENVINAKGRRFKMFFVAVFKDHSSTCKQHFTWDDVCKFAQTLDASCFELSGEVDDNLMFFYNQIVYEYKYYCLKQAAKK